MRKLKVPAVLTVLAIQVLTALPAAAEMTCREVLSDRSKLITEYVRTLTGETLAFQTVESFFSTLKSEETRPWHKNFPLQGTTTQLTYSYYINYNPAQPKELNMGDYLKHQFRTFHFQAPMESIAFGYKNERGIEQSIYVKLTDGNIVELGLANPRAEYVYIQDVPLIPGAPTKNLKFQTATDIQRSNYFYKGETFKDDIPEQGIHLVSNNANPRFITSQDTIRVSKNQLQLTKRGADMDADYTHVEVNVNMAEKLAPIKSYAVSPTGGNLFLNLVDGRKILVVVDLPREWIVNWRDYSMTFYDVTETGFVMPHYGFTDYGQRNDIIKDDLNGNRLKSPTGKEPILHVHNVNPRGD